MFVLLSRISEVFNMAGEHFKAKGSDLIRRIKHLGNALSAVRTQCNYLGAWPY